MTSRSPVAIKTKKARIEFIKEANKLALRGISAEYQNGESRPGVGAVDCRAARINSAVSRERQVWLELMRIGAMPYSWEEYKTMVVSAKSAEVCMHW